jgi:uncharacterized RDD family membrane protein YckC
MVLVEYPLSERYKTFWHRAAAGFVDGLLFIPLNLVYLHLQPPEYGVVASFTVEFFYCLIGILYVVLMHTKYGQTVGKMAAGVKVLDVSEERLPTLGQSCLREIGPIIFTALWLGYHIYLTTVYKDRFDFFIYSHSWKALALAGNGWTLLEIVTMLFNKKRRALHDFIAGTVVVRTD